MLILHTLYPQQKKVGVKGSKIELKANYVALELQDGCCISEFRVKFQPQVDGN